MDRQLTMTPDLQDPNNLDRIRNNQRRSRARRKEYLQELEGKLRKYESMGMEASMEIQASARLVAEENKRLRALLQSRGIMSLEIDTAIGTSGVSLGAPTKAEILDAKLNTPKACYRNRSNIGCSPPQPDKSGQPQTSAGGRDITKRPLPLMPLMTTLQNPTSLPASPALDSWLSSSSLTSSSLTTPAFSPPKSSSHLGDHFPEAAPDLSAEMSPDNDTSSCTFAANIITSMRADVSVEDVKIELGCGKDAECKVDNSTFFTAMDRFTE